MADEVTRPHQGGARGGKHVKLIVSKAPKSSARGVLPAIPEMEEKPGNRHQRKASTPATRHDDPRELGEAYEEPRWVKLNTTYQVIGSARLAIQLMADQAKKFKGGSVYREHLERAAVQYGLWVDPIIRRNRSFKEALREDVSCKAIVEVYMAIYCRVTADMLRLITESHARKDIHQQAKHRRRAKPWMFKKMTPPAIKVIPPVYLEDLNKYYILPSQLVNNFKYLHVTQEVQRMLRMMVEKENTVVDEVDWTRLADHLVSDLHVQLDDGGYLEIIESSLELLPSHVWRHEVQDEDEEFRARLKYCTEHGEHTRAGLHSSNVHTQYHGLKTLSLRNNPYSKHKNLLYDE